MQLTPEGPLAIPLWVNGHPYLTMTDAFYDIIDPRSGETVRRVPLCGAAEAAEAAQAARQAEAGWVELGLAGRQALLGALADALAGYAPHFAGLLDQETACGTEAGEAEVAAAVATLRQGAVGRAGVLGVVADASQPLAGLLQAAVPALMAGATVVVKPSPKAAGAAYALAELTRRVQWPDGVFNLLQGDTAAIEGLCAAEVDRLLYAGEAALGQAVAERASAAGLSCESV